MFRSFKSISKDDWMGIVTLLCACFIIAVGVYLGYEYDLLQYATNRQNISGVGIFFFYLFLSINTLAVLSISLSGVVDIMKDQYSPGGGGDILPIGIVFFLLFYAIGTGCDLIYLSGAGREAIGYSLYGALFALCGFIVDGLAVLILSASILIPYWILRYAAHLVGFGKG